MVFQGCFKRVPRVLQGCFNGVLRAVQGWSKHVLSVFQWCFKDIQRLRFPRMFKRCSEGILRVFQWPINGFSRAFKSMSKLNNVTHARGGFNNI